MHGIFVAISPIRLFGLLSGMFLAITAHLVILTRYAEFAFYHLHLVILIDTHDVRYHLLPLVMAITPNAPMAMGRHDFKVLSNKDFLCAFTSCEL